MIVLVLQDLESKVIGIWDVNVWEMHGGDWVEGVRFSNSVMELFNIHNYCSA